MAALAGEKFSGEGGTSLLLNIVEIVFCKSRNISIGEFAARKGQPSNL